MDVLQNRLAQIHPEIINFDLTVHEMCVDDEEVHTASHQFTPESPDGPIPHALLFPTHENCEAAKFDPLEIVILTMAAIEGNVARTKYSHDGPLPSYYNDGKEILRRYDCVVVLRDNDDRILPVEEDSLLPPEEGC